MKKITGIFFMSLLAVSLFASSLKPNESRKPEISKELKQNMQQIKKQKQIRKHLSMQKHAYQKAARSFIGRNAAGLRMLKLNNR
ncbi:MAG: hypothetical protein AB7E36_00900 [Salinivirgaceae bacterium]